MRALFPRRAFLVAGMFLIALAAPSAVGAAVLSQEPNDSSTAPAAIVLSAPSQPTTTTSQPSPTGTTPADTQELIEEIDKLREDVNQQDDIGTKDFVGFAGTALSAFVGALAALLGIARTNKASSKRELAGRSFDLEKRLWELDRELVTRTRDSITETTRNLSNAYEYAIQAQGETQPAEKKQLLDMVLAARTNAERHLTEVVAVEGRLKSTAPRYDQTLSEYVDNAKAFAQKVVNPTANTLELHELLNDMSSKQISILKVLNDATEVLDRNLDNTRENLAAMAGLAGPTPDGTIRSAVRKPDGRRR